ncbi:hypothetical protein GPL24_10995 [Anaerostipes hadrus]|jgi:hypothetical protein|nr:hypothetical protein [Bacillota bacterium]MBT9903457.1 hypothetical protein [Anaerostipes hadrus]
MITTKGDNYECTEKSLFIKLFVEHIEISLIAILIAIVLGGVVGILISEFERSAKLTLGVINFLYTIPSISMLGFLIPFSGVGNATAVIALLALVMDLILGFVEKRMEKRGKTATKPMTEQYILGEMLNILIKQDTDLNVELTQGVGGGTSNIESAMESGKFDIYPEYTGTGWNMVLKKDGLVVRKEIADKYHLKTYSDLKNIADQLTFGARRVF